MGQEYFRKFCAIIKICKNSRNLKQNLSENTLPFSQRICIIKFRFHFGAVARIAGLRIMLAASIL
jgi:hypothetical protein